jgi:hypothetical protein
MCTDSVTTQARQCNISLGLHGRVIGTLQAGATVKEAATSVRHSERTVRNLRTKYRQTGSITDKPCSGCSSVLLKQQKKIIYRKAHAIQKSEYSELIKEKVFVNLEGHPSKPLFAANYTENLRDVVSLIIRPKSVKNSIAGMLLYVLSLQESTATSCRVAAHLSSQVSAQSRRVQTPTKGGVFNFCGRNGWGSVGFHEVLWDSMKFYDVSVNWSVPTEANRGLTSYISDKVWFSYRKQLSNGCPNKKLDWKNAKYTVTEVINSHSVRLNTPPRIHNVFHVDRLRLASSDPSPSQPNDDTQPASVLVNGELESEVEQIMAEVTYRNRLFFEVKWTGYALTTFEPAENLQDNSALDEWEMFTAPCRNQQSKLLLAGSRRGNEGQFSRRKPLYKNWRGGVM